jgi:hypothetical protein
LLKEYDVAYKELAKWYLQQKSSLRYIRG